MMARRGTTLGLVLTGILVSLCFAAAASAAPRGIIWDPFAEPSWAVAVDGTIPGSYDEATDVVMARGDVTWVCGSLENEAGNRDLSLTRIVGGVRTWTRTYDAYGREDVATSLATGSGGVVYTAGWSYKGVSADLLLVKWSSSGSVLWKRRYDTPAPLTLGTDVVVDRSGNVTVCGYESLGTTVRWIMRSYTAKGAVRWTWRYAPGTPRQAVPRAASAAADGSVYATGSVTDAATSASMTVRISPAGKRLWVKTTRGPAGLYAYSAAIAPCPSGGVYVCGAAQTAAGDNDGLVMRYAPNGARKVFALDGAGGGYHYEDFNDVVVTSTKKIVAVGSSNASGTSDCRVTVYRGDGTSVGGGLTLPGDDGSDTFTCVAADAMGGFVAAGCWWRSATDRQLCVLRGSTLTGGGGWAAVYGGVDSGTACVNAVAARAGVVTAAGAYSGAADSGRDQIVLGFVY